MEDLNMQKSFGGIERERKPSDFDLGSFTPATDYPKVFKPDYIAPIDMQNQTPSCGAHAGVSAENILEEGFQGSPEYLWKRMRFFDKLSPDNGSNLATIMQIRKDYGICSKEICPSNANVSNSQFADPNTLTKEMDIEATNHKITTYAFGWNPTFEELKQKIYQHKSVILLLRVGAEFWTSKSGFSSWNPDDIFPLNPNLPISSAHFVTAYAYDEDYIYFVNSWSDKWGMKGIGYFGKDYISRCIEIGTSVRDVASKFQFTQTLKLGMSGTEVGMLQKVLKQEGLFPQTQSITSYFGNITVQAVKDFQKKYSQDILAPAGLVTPTGVVGEYTRKKLNSLL